MGAPAVARDSYSVLLRVGFARPLLSPGERCALTTPFHPYPRAVARVRAVCFLLHFPSSHLDWPLASTLPKEPGLSSTANNTVATTFRAPAGSVAEYSGAWLGRPEDTEGEEDTEK